MRPYLAIIRDSFREALASRVLWILLLLIFLFLLALAPIGLMETATRRLGEETIRDLPNFLRFLREQATAEASSPAKHIVSLLDEESRKRLAEFRVPEQGDAREGMRFPRLIRELRDGLNKTITRVDFYNKEAWSRVRLDLDELRSLMKKEADQLSEDDLARRNLLLFEAAFPDFVEPTPAVSITIRYLWYDVTPPLPIRRAEFATQLESYVATAIGWFVGVFGVFVAILVTSPIIPQTFDPGSLNLLLSKPIRRSFLFLAKFFGGCSFIVLAGSFLVGGLWLLLGWRLNLWVPKLLWTIPVYAFMFSIYYTVSALAGVVWRNAIVSIALSCLFWFACWCVGTSKIGIEELLLNKLRIVAAIPAGEETIVVNEIGATFRWNQNNSEWEEIFEPKDPEEVQRRMAMAFMPSVPAELRSIGPIYDPHGGQLITAARSFRSGQMMLNVGKSSNGWKNVRGASASFGTQTMLTEPDGRVLVVSSLGLFRLEGDPAFKPGPVKLFGFTLPLPNAGPFRAVGPNPNVLLARPSAAAIDHATGELVIYSRGSITVLKRDDSGNYAVRIEKKTDIDVSESVVMAAGGGRILISQKDGSATIYGAESIDVIETTSVDASSQPRFVSASPSGRFFSIAMHNGRLWLYDAKADSGKRWTLPNVSGQGDVSGASLIAGDRLQVADRTTRLTEYELPSLKVVRRFAPSMTLAESAYRYGICPLYFVFPKPGELDKTAQYFLSGKETKNSSATSGDLAAAQKQLHPWRPVISSFVFMLVTLFLGCVYLERQDF